MLPRLRNQPHYSIMPYCRNPPASRGSHINRFLAIKIAAASSPLSFEVFGLRVTASKSIRKYVYTHIYIWLDTYILNTPLISCTILGLVSTVQTPQSEANIGHDGRILRLEHVSLATYRFVLEEPSRVSLAVNLGLLHCISFK